MTIGVRAGAIGEQVARSAFPKATIQPFEDVDVALEALLTGKVTAFVAKSPAPEFLLAKGGNKLFLPLADARIAAEKGSRRREECGRIRRP